MIKLELSPSVEPPASAVRFENGFNWRRGDKMCYLIYPNPVHVKNSRGEWTEHELIKSEVGYELKHPNVPTNFKKYETSIGHLTFVWNVQKFWRGKWVPILPKSVELSDDERPYTIIERLVTSSHPEPVALPGNEIVLKRKIEYDEGTLVQEFVVARGRFAKENLSFRANKNIKLRFVLRVKGATHYREKITPITGIKSKFEWVEKIRGKVTNAFFDNVWVSWVFDAHKLVGYMLWCVTFGDYDLKAGEVANLDPIYNVLTHGDSYVSTCYPNTNYGGELELWMGIKYIPEAGACVIWRAYFQFNIPSLKGDIIKAELCIRRPRGTAYGYDYDCHRVLATWDELTITWNNQPIFAAEYTDRRRYQWPYPDPAVWNVKSDIPAGGNVWRSWVIKHASELYYQDEYIVCDSREIGAAYSPYLYIETLWDVEVAAGVGVQSIPAIQGKYIISPPAGVGAGAANVFGLSVSKDAMVSALSSPNFALALERAAGVNAGASPALRQKLTVSQSAQISAVATATIKSAIAKYVEALVTAGATPEIIHEVKEKIKRLFGLEIIVADGKIEART